MAISNYGELKTAVAGWIKSTALTARIPEFIALAETALSHDLSDLRPLQARTTITTTAATRRQTAPTGIIALKSAFLVSPDDTLEIVPSDLLQWDDGVSGIPDAIALEGENLLFNPTPDAIYSIQLLYTKRITALSSDSDTNYILTNWPNLYLFRALVEAATYTEDDENLRKYAARYEDAMDKARSQNWDGYVTLQPEVARYTGNYGSMGFNINRGY